MKRCFLALAASCFFFPLIAAPVSASQTKAVELEQSGDVAGARETLQKAVQQSPGDVDSLVAYADLLDRYRDPEARAAYRKVVNAAPSRSSAALRRLVLLDLAAGDRAAAEQDLSAYRTANGAGLALPPEHPLAAAGDATIQIPGPLRSFARMAAIASESTPADVLPALARNVVINGYQASRSNDVLEATEFMKLLTRYISQARELDKLAGADHVIRIETCDSTQSGELLRVLGFRIRGACGSEVVLETVNAPRAFLTTDSGFPMALLEQSLRTNRPFAYDYQPSLVPLPYGPAFWINEKTTAADFLDAFVGDPSVCRFFLGMSHLDRATADDLKKNVPVARLRAFAHVLDFFGGMFEIRDGKAVTPGGPRAAAAWGELVGVSPEKGAQFFEKLLAKDDGWLASLYDSIARVHGPALEYLTEPARMRRFYTAVRGQLTSPGPARPVFRANADMMLLTNRLRIDANGQAHIPGGVAVWKGLFANHPHSKYDSKLTKASTNWKDGDDVVEALFALCRKAVENEPLKIFMAMSDLDRYRTTPLQPATVDRLARDYRVFGSQYTIIADAPQLSDATILAFLDDIESLDHIHDNNFRQDAVASMEALVGMWGICLRQGSLPASAVDSSLLAILKPFADVNGNTELFDASRAGIAALLSATGSPATDPHGAILSLLADGRGEGGEDVRDQLTKEMQRVLDAQRIVSLNTIQQFADNLDKAAAGKTFDPVALQKLATRIGETQLPRASLSGAERNVMTFGYFTEHHIDMQRKLNLRALIDKAGKDADKIRDIRGAIAPILRDTLVGFNYAYYAPPGAQILFTNPLFVRGHDFVGLPGSNTAWRQAELLGTGWPTNAGGRLIGSLANLPYALAEAEQNFLVPAQTQALIWGDLVPQMILSSKVPRWWTVTPAQLHWVGLHMGLAETILAQAALSPDERSGVMSALRPQLPPGRLYQVDELIESGRVRAAIEALTPLELYVLADTLRTSPRYAEDPLSAAIKTLAAKNSAEVSEASISRAFGTPKPTLSNSYRPELLKLRTFPTLMGYSSRIMAESWESNALYWGALADQMHVAPAQLNLLVPSWTEKVAEQIFASHLEDWPALLHSLRAVGKEISSGNGGTLQASE